MEELSRKEKKGQAIQKKILDSATFLFDKYGYSNVRMSQIADNADLTTGAMYYYFKGKDEILDLVASHYISRVSDIAEGVYCRENISSVQKISILIKEHCEGVARYRPHLSIFYREYNHLTPESLQKAISMNGRFLSFTTKIIEDGIREGAFRKDVDPKVAALGIIGMCNWMYQWFSMDGPFSDDQVGEMFLRMITEGLNVKSTKEAPSENSE